MIVIMICFINILLFCVVGINARLIGGSILRTMCINDKIKEQEQTISELKDSYYKLNNYITLNTICVLNV